MSHLTLFSSLIFLIIINATFSQNDAFKNSLSPMDLLNIALKNQLNQNLTPVESPKDTSMLTIKPSPMQLFSDTFMNSNFTSIESPKDTSMLTIKPSRMQLFTEIVIKTVRASPQLFGLFMDGSSFIDGSKPEPRYSVYFFRTFRNALRQAGIEHANSLAKPIADALYMTLPYMTKDMHIIVVADSIALYLLAQDILTLENGPLLADTFCGVLNQAYAKNGNLTQLAKARTISNAIVEFLTSTGIKHVPAFSISVAKLCFSYTIVMEILMDETLVSPRDKIISAAERFGIDAFRSRFLKHVYSSPVLQDIFYLVEPASVVSKAWNDAVSSFCTSINCYKPDVSEMSTAVLQTYDYMSISTYIEAIANGYALMLLGLGDLNAISARLKADDVAKTIESLARNMGSNADFEDRIMIIFQAFRQLIGRKFNLQNQFVALINHISFEFYAATDANKPINF